MIRKYDGKDLARVLIYYGLIGDVSISDFNIICPFHDDINPSMRITLDDGQFFCFGCRASGNAYDFVRLANPQLNELQCCILLEQIVNSKEVKTINVKYKKKKKKNNKQALVEASDYFYGLRSVDWNNTRTEDERKTLEYMQGRGFTKRALNIADCRVNYNIAYPFVFPILDNGEFKGWVGRTTNKYTAQKRKYLYNDGFRKRDTICGNYSENCIPWICEGYMDYLSLRTRGHIKNTCALLGWHLADEQMKKLKEKGITTVVSALDNDKCGIKGTEYLKKFFNVIRFPYPEYIKDVGEMTEEQFKKQIQIVKKQIKKVKQSETKN
jgi:DNA primase